MSCELIETTRGICRNVMALSNWIPWHKLYFLCMYNVATDIQKGQNWCCNILAPPSHNANSNKTCLKTTAHTNWTIWNKSNYLWCKEQKSNLFLLQTFRCVGKKYCRNILDSRWVYHMEEVCWLTLFQKLDQYIRHKMEL